MDTTDAKIVTGLVEPGRISVRLRDSYSSENTSLALKLVVSVLDLEFLHQIDLYVGILEKIQEIDGN